MEYAHILGISAGVLTSIRFIPQLFKTIRMKETRDLSLWFLVIAFFQALLLILYGLEVSDGYIVAMNISPLICLVVLLYFKYIYK